MAWRDTDGRDLPPDWRHTIRPTVLKRDDHRCTWITQHGRCTWNDPTGRTLEVDHIGDRDNHHPDNLRTLCAHGSHHNHHGQRTAQQGVAARPTRTRPTTPHPGLTDDQPRQARS